MKKIRLVFTLLVIVTGVYSFGQSVPGSKPKQEFVKFCVDYRISIEKYDSIGNFLVNKKYISSGMFKQEKSVGRDTLSGVLLTFSGFVSSQDILSWIKENGMRPAMLKELQAFGIQIGIFPNSGVVAFGSEVISDGVKSIPLIINDKNGMSISLYPVEGKWNGSFYELLCIVVN